MVDRTIGCVKRARDLERIDHPQKKELVNTFRKECTKASSLVDCNLAG